LWCVRHTSRPMEAPAAFSLNSTRLLQPRLNGVYEVAACDDDFEGAMEDIEWELCVVRGVGDGTVTVQMVSDSEIIQHISMGFLRLPVEQVRRRGAPLAYSETESATKRPRLTINPEPPRRGAVVTATRHELMEHIMGAFQRRADRRMPQACAFGGDHGSSGGAHDDDGNFYRPGMWVWTLVKEAADTEFKTGRSRDGLTYYCTPHPPPIATPPSPPNPT